MNWQQHFSTRAQQMTASEIREILKAISKPGVISFAGGIPAKELFPYEEFQEAFQQIFTDVHKRAEALQYSISEGYPPLREWIAEQYCAKGIQLGIENVFITSGSQQGLDFLGKLLVNQGDQVVVENPSYLGAFQAFNAYGATYLPIRTDEHGMVVEEVESLLQQDPAFLYIMPNFQNPRGVTLSLERREQLVKLAHQYNVPILEDDAYGQLRYEGEFYPSLLEIDAQTHGGKVEDGITLHMGTFSKIMAPGLRVAWTIAPKPIIERLVFIKQAADLHTSTMNQMVIYEALCQNFLDEQIGKLRATYQARRDAMLNALENHFPDGVRWTHPQGGMFLWVTLPEGMSGKDLLAESLETVKIAFVPGEAFFADRTGKNTMRLNFSMMPPQKIEEGIAKLGAFLKERL